MKKKITVGVIIALVIAFAVVRFSCGGNKKDGQQDAEEEIIDGEAGEDEQEDSAAAPEEAGDGGETEEDEEELPMLTEEEATVLVEEKLEGIKCEAVFNDEAEIDGKIYYTYTVLDENGEEIDQMLAVSGFSGEVSVYDILKNTVSDYSGFVYFDAEKDVPVNWEGSFTNGKLKCILEPSSENMFEFTLSGGKEFVGVAAAEGRVAEYSDDSLGLKFTMDGKKLTIEDISGKSGYAGTYAKGENK
ncbi:MAG: hypothetical protein K5985_02580 [Lachnospiraceae bacterium]|nr:hypothetical protein [Lachnospiraceae bacterium]